MLAPGLIQRIGVLQIGLFRRQHVEEVGRTALIQLVRQLGENFDAAIFGRPIARFVVQTEKQRMTEALRFVSR